MSDKEEAIKLKAKAALYARTFLTNKYRDEYQELYDAYLINRGYKPRRAQKQDERILLNNKE